MNLGRHLDPKSDLVFKKVFGTEGNKDIVIDFLNDVLNKKGKEKIREISFFNTTQHPTLVDKKQSFIDILCIDEAGTNYIVEMQVAKMGDFEKRAQYYAAKAYTLQADKGDGYRKLKDVILLAILNFVMFPNKLRYKSEHITLDKVSFEHDLKDLAYVFIELPKFTKTVEELVTDEEKWCYFFKHAHETENMDKLLGISDESLKKAYEQLSSYHWTEQELAAYDQQKKIEWDRQARELYITEEAREEGLAQGRAQGIAQGLTQGRAEGEARGIAEGEKNRSQEIAKKILSEGMASELVAKMTGLSLEEVKLIVSSSKP
jgi:predicted transposase/invertase (TIGR01784 family)